MDLSNNQLTFSFSIERILAMPTLSPAVTSGSSSKDTFSTCNNYHLHLFNNNNFGNNNFATRDNINNSNNNNNNNSSSSSSSSNNNRYQVNDALDSIAITSTFAEKEDFASDRYNNLQADSQLYPSMASIREALTLPIESSPRTVSPVNQLTRQCRQSQLIVTETHGSHLLQCHLQERKPGSTMRRQEQQSLEQSDQINFSSLVPFYKSTNYLETGIFNSINTASSSSKDINSDKSGGSEKSYFFARQCHSPTSTSSLEEKVAIQSHHSCVSALQRQLHYLKRPNAAGSGIRGKHLLKQLANPSSIDSIETAQYKKVKEEQVGENVTKDSQFDNQLQPSTSAAASSSNKCRRFSRAVFTESQRIGLENAFQASQYIQKGCRTQLAESLGLTELQVKVWFQNRRMKWRSSKEYQSFSRRTLSGSNSSQFSKKLRTTDTHV